MNADIIASDNVTVEPITHPDDFVAFFDICAKAFGHQTADGIWTAANPRWDTPEGTVQGVVRLVDRWRTTKDEGYTHFLKASVSMNGSGQHIVGVAIWINASLVHGHGQVPDCLDFTSLCPGNERETRFLTQVIGTMQAHRRHVLEEKASPSSSQKSVFILDICALDPDFQRRGIASMLVEWGLNKAKREGDVELVTEASTMGRSVYKRLGFWEVANIEYMVDDEFKDRKLPSNVFLRTRP